MLTKFRRTVLSAGSALIGKVGLTDSGGTEVTDPADHAVKARLIEGDDVIGKVGLVDAQGNSISRFGVDLSASYAHIGKVSGVLKKVAASKILVGGACSAEDILSESTSVATPWIFAGVGRQNGAGGYIVKATAIIQTTALTPRITLFLFNAPPTCAVNDNVANTAVLLADRFIHVGQIDFPAMEDLGTGTSGTIATPSTSGNLPLAFICDPMYSDLWGIVVARDAVTPTALDIMYVTLTVEQY